jgi:hypothetical protein
VALARQMGSGTLAVSKNNFAEFGATIFHFHTMTWSKHSRRTEPISRSTYGLEKVVNSTR